jgi:cellulose synthase/poly-beta-1,6-N-acetylglucosamine synthase-like glycosyltransferase
MTTILAAVAFWACSATLAYVYVLYPLLVRTLAARIGTPARSDDALRTVTVIVTAYNEEGSIRAKLDNLTLLDYPSELVRIIVASDGSTDATEQIASTYDPTRVRVLRIEGRTGKTACQNAAAAEATGEILLFTDATTQLSPTALRLLVGTFGDPTVGCAAGRLVYRTDAANATGRGGEAYWGYETKLRAGESLLGSMIGVSGCLYAVRRRAYRPIDPQLIGDFVIAMRMREQGLRTVLAADAVCYEETLDSPSRELAMRVRVALRSLNALFHEHGFLNPFRYGRFAWQLWSHKALRYASPLLWIGALVANMLLAQHSLPYLALLLGQCTVIAAGATGFLLQGGRRQLGILGQPYYFLLTNLASLLAMVRYVRGERMVTWQPIRDDAVRPDQA